MPAKNELESLVCPGLQAAPGCPTTAELAKCPVRAGLFSLLRCNPQPSAICDMDDKIVWVNEAFCDFLEYTEAQLVGNTIESLTHPDDWAVDADSRTRIVNGEIDHYTMVRRFLTATGNAVEVVQTTHRFSAKGDSPPWLIRYLVPSHRSLIAQLQSLKPTEPPETTLPPTAAAWKTAVVTWLTENCQTVAALVAATLAAYVWLQTLRHDVTTLQHEMGELKAGLQRLIELSSKP